jgi:hypothetical protein
VTVRSGSPIGTHPTGLNQADNNFNCDGERSRSGAPAAHGALLDAQQTSKPTPRHTETAERGIEFLRVHYLLARGIGGPAAGARESAFVGTASAASPFLTGFCAGVVRGVAVMAIGDGAERERRSPAASMKPPACARIPDEATNEQMVRVVVRYIEARPERMHEPLSILALDALEAA